MRWPVLKPSALQIVEGVLDAGALVLYRLDLPLEIVLGGAFAGFGLCFHLLDPPVGIRQFLLNLSNERISILRQLKFALGGLQIRGRLPLLPLSLTDSLGPFAPCFGNFPLRIDHGLVVKHRFVRRAGFTLRFGHALPRLLLGFASLLLLLAKVFLRFGNLSLSRALRAANT
jgi:hypothetical protein